MEETFLQLHERLLKDGVNFKTKLRTIDCGLCCVDFKGGDLMDDKIFELVCPTAEDSYLLKGCYYWGSESYLTDTGVYTPLRQTLILFCAALNGEL